jgi:hypothetical protein
VFFSCHFPNVEPETIVRKSNGVSAQDCWIVRQTTLLCLYSPGKQYGHIFSSIMEPEVMVSNGSLSLPHASSTTTTSPHPLQHPSPPARINDNVFESLKLEYQLMKVPFEQLKKSIRISHKLVEKEMNSVVSGVAEAVDKDLTKEEAVQHLTNLVSRLQGLKRKVRDDGLYVSNLAIQREEMISMVL